MAAAGGYAVSEGEVVSTYGVLEQPQMNLWPDTENTLKRVRGPFEPV